MARKLVGGSVSVSPFRHLHNRLHSADMVEEVEKRRSAGRDELGRRDPLCSGAGLLHLHVCRPELSDPLVVAREIAARGRLSVGQQNGLRPACAQHPDPLPSGSEHTAIARDEELCRLAPVEIPPPARLRQRRARRHRGFQLPRRRHRGAEDAEPRLLYPRARFRPRAYPQQSADLRKDHLPPRRPPRELCQARRGTSGRTP